MLNLIKLQKNFDIYGIFNETFSLLKQVARKKKDWLKWTFPSILVSPTMVAPLGLNAWVSYNRLIVWPTIAAGNANWLALISRTFYAFK